MAYLALYRARGTREVPFYIKKADSPSERIEASGRESMGDKEKESWLVVYVQWSYLVVRSRLL